MSIETIGTALLQAFDNCAEAEQNGETHEQFMAREATEKEAEEIRKGQDYRKESAEAEMDALIDQFDALSCAAKQVKEGIAEGNEAKVREALDELDNHVDGYWHRLVMSYGTGQIHDYLESLNWGK